MNATYRTNSSEELQCLSSLVLTKSAEKLLSNEDLATFLLVNAIISCPLCLFGISFNLINVFIFSKSSLSNTVNISLFAKALADIGSLLTYFWMNINAFPGFHFVDPRIRPTEMMVATGAWPRVCFSRITSWITIFVTAERWVCIALPLKVRDIFTPRLIIPALCLIYILNIFSVVPAFLNFRMEWKSGLMPNTTVYGLTVKITDLGLVGSVYLQVLLQFLSYEVAIILTAVIVFSFKQNLKWRIHATSSSGHWPHGISDRDNKIIRMIIFLTCTLIVCYSPGTLFQVIHLIEPEFSTGGKYNNIQRVCWFIGSLLEAINSSVNIFIYYSLSSKYRDAIQNFLHWRLSKISLK